MRGDEPLDAKEARPCLTLLAQLLVLQRHLRDLNVSLLPPLKVLPSLFARNRVFIVYFARLEIQREGAREQLDIE